jgi:hypothetical protein
MFNNFNQIELCMRMQVKKWGVFEHFYATIFQLWCINLGPNQTSSYFVSFDVHNQFGLL